MRDPADPRTPASPDDLVSTLAFALRFEGRKRVRNTDEHMAEIVARRLAAHLARSGFVVIRRPAGIGGATLGRGFEG